MSVPTVNPGVLSATFLCVYCLICICILLPYFIALLAYGINDADVEVLTGEVSSQEDGPVGRRMEPMVVAGSEVDDAVVELVERVGQQAVVVGEVVAGYHVVLVGKQRLERSEEADQRIRDSFHLLQHAMLHLSTVEHLAVCWTGLQQQTSGYSNCS